MRRFVFYILVTLLTFGVSSLIALKFHWKNNEKPANNNDLTQTKIESETGKELGYDFAAQQIEQVSFENEKRPKPFCKDKRISSVWKELKKDKIFKDFEEVFYVNSDCQAMLEVKEIDLDNNGTKEFILRGNNGNFCSGTGNCGFWIFEKNGKDYKKLLSSIDNSEELEITYQIQSNVTKKYHNILLREHINALETGVSLYKFDGEKYSLDKSLIEVYDINNKREILSCKEWEKREAKLQKEQK